jgi:molybdopterin synthase sulfur carrier subunit
MASSVRLRHPGVVVSAAAGARRNGRHRLAGGLASTMVPMVALRLFASAREAAGIAVDDLPGATVGEVLDNAADRYGPAFVAQLEQCRVWRNGEPAGRAASVTSDDEVAVLPPVSGGC